jgi:hypothetical protein
MLLASTLFSPADLIALKSGELGIISSVDIPMPNLKVTESAVTTAVESFAESGRTCPYMAEAAIINGIMMRNIVKKIHNEQAGIQIA